MAIWTSGNNIGILLAFMFGGIIAQRYGWRTAFVAAGIATVLFAVLVRLTVREPARSVEAGPIAMRARGPRARVGASTCGATP